MNTIKWGIIGCGNVCEKKSGPAFYKIENSELVAVMRRDEELVKSFATRHHVAKYYTNADELIADADVNAVYIATPPSSHKEYAIKALNAGKSVYVEKPMALNYSECLEMIETAGRNKQKLFVAFYRRALPYFLKVKELLDNKLIGDILTVELRHFRTPSQSDIQQKENWRLNEAVAGGGYFYDLAPHSIDILDFLLGEISEAKGFTANRGGYYQVEDTVSAIFKFRSGVLGTGQWCFVSSEESVEDSIKITGTKGVLQFSTFAFSPIELIRPHGKELFSQAQPEHIQQPLIQTIVNDLKGKGECPSTGITAARTSRIIDMIFDKG